MAAGIDRRIAGGIAGLACALAIFGIHRFWVDFRSIPILLTCLVLVGSQALLLGRARGAVVALLIAAALNRYSSEFAGATVKPEHIVAPLTGLLLLPDLRRLLARLDRVDLFVLAWLLWSLVPGLLNAPDPGNSTRLWMMLMLAAFGYFAVALTVRTAGRAYTVFTAWLTIATGIGIWGLVTHFAYHALDVNLGIQVNPVTFDPSIPGPFHEANLFGSAVMMAGLTGLALLALGGGPQRLAWTASLVGLLAVQVSFTRTVWIAYLGGLILIALGKVIYQPRRRVLPQPAGITAFGGVFALAILGTVALWVPFSNTPQPPQGVAFSTPTPLPPGAPTPTPAPTQTFLQRGTPVAEHNWTPAVREADIAGRVGSIASTNDSSVRLRLEFIRIALRDWREHPLVGLGIGSFGQEYINSSNERAWLTMFAVRILHDGGVVGVLLFGTALALLLVRVVGLLRARSGGRVERIALAMAVGIAAMFVAFLATEGLQLAWYWCSLGLFAALVRIAAQPRPAPGHA